MAHATLHPIWPPIWSKKVCLSKQEGAVREVLFVGHREDAVPARGRLIEEILLAALPIGAGRTVIGPLVENDLEGFLRILPAALAVELVGLPEELDPHAHFVGAAVHRILPA